MESLGCGFRTRATPPPDRQTGGVIIGIGIDVVPVDRFAESLTRTPGLRDRLFTAAEQATPSGGRRTGESLAARFAAKEAAAKALGVGLRGLGGARAERAPGVAWHEIEVVRAPSGQPALRLAGRAADRAAELGWHAVALSLSHTRQAAVASVVALATAGGDREQGTGDRG